MSLFRKARLTTDSSDEFLVTAALGGDRDAFGEIVSRYQSLLCSLAYSAVGDFNHSEDIAQEAFVEAWGKLDTLRDPEKLKAWLCGILRFKVSRFHRKEARQPVKHADELSELGGLGAEESGTEDTAISDEEQAILWRAIANVPETYREPLILFYREERSTKQVADALDLSEDAVKQRLSRGRKLLQAEMMTVVEKVLVKSRPGATFTAAVLAVIASIPPPAKAATLGAAAAKAGSWFQWANVLAYLASFSGVVSTFFGIRAGLDQSRTKRERRRVFKVAGTLFFYPIAFVVLLFVLRHLAMSAAENAAFYAIATQVLVVGFALSYGFLVFRMFKGSRMLRASERERHPDAFTSRADQAGSGEREYKSRWRLAGIPLIHFRLGMPEKDDGPVVGWVAGGDRAYGLLFAWGGFAVAPVSVGIYSIGLVTVGAVGLGVVGIGTVGIGIIAFGGAAMAWKAYASLSALGWESAFSQGVAIAREGAIAPVAIASQVNNEQAADIVHLAAFGQTYLWALAAITLLVIVPSIWYSNEVRQRMRVTDRESDHHSEG